MRFSVQLSANYHTHQHLLRYSSAEEDLGVLVGTELNVNEHCDLAAKKINDTLGCFRPAGKER